MWDSLSTVLWTPNRKRAPWHRNCDISPCWVSSNYRLDCGIDTLVLVTNTRGGTNQMSETGVEKKQGSRQGRRGFRLIHLVILVAIIVTLAAIFIPNVIRTDWPPRKFYYAARGTKAAVTQAIVYANDNGVYPTSMKVLREEGYAPVRDKDSWGNDYVLAQVFTEGRTPREGDHVYVFSRGPKGTGVYPQPFTSDTGKDGAIGYSSVDGCFGPEYFDVC